MRVEVTRDELNALVATRKLRSPGGVGQLLGMTRQAVMWHVDQEKRTPGFLAWVLARRQWKAEWEIYVDLGSQQLLENDPRAWWTEDPRQVLRQAVREYARILADRASGE